MLDIVKYKNYVQYLRQNEKMAIFLLFYSFRSKLEIGKGVDVVRLEIGIMILNSNQLIS